MLLFAPPQSTASKRSSLPQRNRWADIECQLNHTPNTTHPRCSSCYQITDIPALGEILTPGHPSHLVMEEVRLQQQLDKIHTRAFSGLPRARRPEEQGRSLWQHSPHPAALLPEPALLGALGAGTSSDVFAFRGGCIYCVRSAVFVWMLNSDVYLPSTRLQPAEFWEQQLLKTRLTFSTWGPTQQQAEADRSAPHLVSVCGWFFILSTLEHQQGKKVHFINKVFWTWLATGTRKCILCSHLLCNLA
mgnify:CR=1 FL=1